MSKRPHTVASTLSKKLSIAHKFVMARGPDGGFSIFLKWLQAAKFVHFFCFRLQSYKTYLRRATFSAEKSLHLQKNCK